MDERWWTLDGGSLRGSIAATCSGCSRARRGRSAFTSWWVRLGMVCAASMCTAALPAAERPKATGIVELDAILDHERPSIAELGTLGHRLVIEGRVADAEVVQRAAIHLLPPYEGDAEYLDALGALYYVLEMVESEISEAVFDTESTQRIAASLERMLVVAEPTRRQNGDWFAGRMRPYAQAYASLGDLDAALQTLRRVPRIPSNAADQGGSELRRAWLLATVYRAIQHDFRGALDAHDQYTLACRGAQDPLCESADRGRGFLADLAAGKGGTPRTDADGSIDILRATVLSTVLRLERVWADDAHALALSDALTVSGEAMCANSTRAVDQDLCRRGLARALDLRVKAAPDEAQTLRLRARVDSLGE